MRHPYQIDFIATEQFTTYIRREDGFKFVPKGKTVWLQKMAWKFLNWAMAITDYHEPVVKVTRHTVDSERFMEKLWAQQREIFRFFDHDASLLLIGSEDYAEMMNSPEAIPHYFAFSGDYGRDQTICKLQVKVIPWMRGMVAMP
jgi:hypothetical protein